MIAWQLKVEWWLLNIWENKGWRIRILSSGAMLTVGQEGSAVYVQPHVGLNVVNNKALYVSK